MWKNSLITDEKSIAKIFNDYFTSVIKHLLIERNEFDSKSLQSYEMSKTTQLEWIPTKVVKEILNVLLYF